jgi:hypothetical protein
MAKGKKTGGRKKGVPNKITADIRAAVVEAFDRAGGVDYLVKLASIDPRTFCGLVGKVIPLQVAGDPNNPIFPSRVEIRLVGPQC